MATQLHLVGQFPGWNTTQIISAVGSRLLGRIAYWPLADMDVKSPASELDALRSAKEEGWIPNDAKTQVTLMLGNELELENSLGDQYFKNLENTAVQLDIPLWKMAPLENDRISLVGTWSSKIAQIINALPNDVQVLLHFCCGSGAQYSMSARDMEVMVELSNQLQPLLTRAIARVHFPAPLRHNDDSYFRSLRNLSKAVRAVSCLGIIHLSDGLEGAMYRWSLASRYISGFSIGARCGFGERTNEEILRFLDLHAEVGLRLDEEN